MKTKYSAFVAVLVIPLLSGGVLGTASAETTLSDQEISNAVDDQMMVDPATPAWNIDVTTSDGIVTLTGSVNNLLAKDQAGEVASTIKGVRGVVNRIEVEAPFQTDIEIAEGVRDALIADAATESWEIPIAVQDGVVTLQGTVDSWQEKQLAAQVAKGVKGVRGIDNDIRVDYKVNRLDGEIQEEVEAALRWDSRVDDALINVAVDGGNVSLKGTVGSLAEKNRVYRKAWVAGVKSVDNQDLQVKWWARDDRLRKDKYVNKTDTEIKQAIQDAFLYDPRVLSFQVAVEPNGGYVTLRGTVDNLKAKRAAAQDARGVVGVWSVNNKIKVRPGTPSDTRIEGYVEGALLRDPYVDRFDIDVSVVDGEVYLYGDVGSTFEKARTDDLASRQTGVRAVHNFLSVNHPNGGAYNPYTDDYYLYDYDWYVSTDRVPLKADWEIQEDIEDEFFWSPFVDGDAVKVDVDNGIAHLTGEVDTWSEREAATENAFEGGAALVDNDLLVDYGPED